MISSFLLTPTWGLYLEYKRRNHIFKYVKRNGPHTPKLASSVDLHPIPIKTLNISMSIYMCHIPNESCFNLHSSRTICSVI